LSRNESSQSSARLSSETTSQTTASIDQSTDRKQYWRLIPLRARGARPPLFCIFPGPPGARDLAEVLPEDQPVFDFHYPNLDGETSFPTVENLASAYVQDVRGVQPHGPYQLCGYSNGGLIAYEMARLLLLAGENVSFLALFETWHPQFGKSLSPADIRRIQRLYLADRAKKYARNLLQKGLLEVAASAWMAVTTRAKFAAWRVSRLMFRAANRPVPRKMQEVEAIASLQTFVPKPYPERFMLIRTRDPFEMQFKDQTFGWQVCALKGVDVYFVQGQHGTMVLKPHVSDLAGQISPFLQGVPRQ